MNDEVISHLVDRTAHLIANTAIRLGMMLEPMPKQVQMETVAMLVARLGLAGSVNEILELSKGYPYPTLESNREAE